MSIEDVIRTLEDTMAGGIDPQEVESIYGSSLAEDLPETDPNYKITDGILAPTAFDMGKLNKHRARVAAMLSWLPTNFRVPEQGGGGGWSFLSACDDREGRQWTGLHQRMDQLFQLGMALDMVVCLMPRSMWRLFPGGMPYYEITLPEDL